MSRPQNVGILGIEVFFPSTYVNQAELEQFDKVSKGKYTIGLGQQNMAFASGFQDVVSLSLTALHNLLEKYGISPKNVGRLEVGTETLIDKSKSLKTFLMDFFAKYDNYSIEGISSTNACYGGTAALFNTIAWVESSAWDGRLGIVLAADVAVYAKGGARPTGGAGVVAMLIGPNANIIIEQERSTYMENAYDFYKPILNSEYPVVDGHYSINCYLNAIDKCYEDYKAKKKEDISMGKFDFLCFHTPFGKMVYKSFLRIIYNDIRCNVNYGEPSQMEHVRANDFNEKKVQEILALISKDLWKTKCQTTLLLSSQLGNIYTGALYGCLASLINNQGSSLLNKKILMFSYGSGLAASLFVLKVVGNLDQMKNNLNLMKRLEGRKRVEPELYDQIMLEKEQNYGKAPFIPKVNLELLEDGEYYLEKIDEKYRRFYQRKKLEIYNIPAYRMSMVAGHLKNKN